jgi:hypothetical protein
MNRKHGIRWAGWATRGLITIGLLLGAVRQAGTAVAQTAIRIAVDRPGIHISPKLWGIFFEEINYAGQGGLYAEMVKNGTFKWVANQNYPVGWHLMVAPHKGNASLWVDFNHPLNKENVVCGRVLGYAICPWQGVSAVFLRPAQSWDEF